MQLLPSETFFADVSQLPFYKVLKSRVAKQVANIFLSQKLNFQSQRAATKRKTMLCQSEFHGTW